MNKDKFFKIAHETKASSCLEFNWDYNYRKAYTCMRDFYETDILHPCTVFNGGECEFYKEREE